MQSYTVNCPHIAQGIWFFNIDSHKILKVISAHKELSNFTQSIQVNIIPWYHPSSALIE